MLKSKFFKLKYTQFYCLVVGVFKSAQTSQAPFLCQIQSWNNSGGCNSTRTTNHFSRRREVIIWLKTERERKEKLDWAHYLIEFTDLNVIFKPLFTENHLKSPFFSVSSERSEKKNKMVKRGYLLQSYALLYQPEGWGKNAERFTKICSTKLIKGNRKAI